MTSTYIALSLVALAMGFMAREIYKLRRQVADIDARRRYIADVTDALSDRITRFAHIAEISEAKTDKLGREIDLIAPLLSSTCFVLMTEVLADDLPRQLDEAMAKGLRTSKIRRLEQLMHCRRVMSRYTTEEEDL